MKTGVELIAAERKKQILRGRSLEEDQRYNAGKQMAFAAISIAHPEAHKIGFVEPEGWDKDHFKRMKNKSYKKRLIIAGALIAAELDRIQ